MTDRELMQQALDALKQSSTNAPFDAHGVVYVEGVKIHKAAIAALNERLAQPEQEPVHHAVIAGVLFDFMGWLTSRKERFVLSSADEASPAVEAIRDFAKMRGLFLDDAKVLDWNPAPQPEQEPVEVDQATMELAESVGLIGPASRTHDLHQAIQRFHDLICVNATVKAAQMAADVIRESTPPQRTWVGLTDEEVMEIAFNFDVPSLVVRTVEVKLKEKNT